MHITVNLGEQTLSLWNGDVLMHRWPVSTAANGAGEINGSGCTPRGRHVVRAKIGGGVAAGTVFKARRVATDVPVFSPELCALYPGRDWILSRILWLSGCELGVNRLGCVDTMRRYIYIHGTADEHTLGLPRSHGCIRMGNADVMKLFDLITVGTEVTLHE